MLLGVLVAFIATASGWAYTVLTVEIIETAGFVLFWAAQSADLWDVGIVADKQAVPAAAGK